MDFWGSFGPVGDLLVFNVNSGFWLVILEVAVQGELVLGCFELLLRAPFTDELSLSSIDTHVPSKHHFRPRINPILLFLLMSVYQGPLLSQLLHFILPEDTAVLF